MTDALARLDALARPFRSDYLDYETLSAQLRAWAEAFPELVRLESIGTSEEGRELWLMTLGEHPDRLRPAAWIDANLHAVEVCGSSVALALAEDILRLHLGGEPLHGLSAGAVDTLREILVYVLPRCSPDGAEAVLRDGRYVRSVPRDHRPDRNRARWRSGDVDGDGLSLLMRLRDPTGEYVEHPGHPGLMVPRTIDDPGPFYKLYPEGTIENFNGRDVPTPRMLADNQTDLNRNFPYTWGPGHQQYGAGEYPGSEPESRAIIEFVSRHPNIFAWIDFHTFGGVFIRPLGDKPDNEMNPADLALFRQLEAWHTEHTGYPTVSGFEEFTYEPNKPLRGDLSDYAYNQRGCVAYVCELWDLFEQLGLEKPDRFVDRYTKLDRKDLLALARWDAEHNEGRVLRPWIACEHPQLGAVEVGGLDPRVGLWNPPPDRLAEICKGQAAAFLRLAALAPRVRLNAKIEAVGEERWRVELCVENHGYLPTHVLASAQPLEFNEPLALQLEVEGCALAPAQAPFVELGHLDGWGRGLYGGDAALYFLRSRGSTGRAHASVHVEGRGQLRVRVGSCRVGWVERALKLE